MGTYSNTMRAVREQADQRKIASEMAAVTRDLDMLSRREDARRTDAPKLARAILEHRAMGQSLRRATAAQRKDSRYSFWQSEHEILGKALDEKVRRYVTAGIDPRIVTLGLEKWARKVLAAARAGAAKPKPKRSARPVRKTAKASRAGRCPECRRQVDYLTTTGVCNGCLEKLYPRIARRR